MGRVLGMFAGLQERIYAVFYGVIIRKNVIKFRHNADIGTATVGECKKEATISIRRVKFRS